MKTKIEIENFEALTILQAIEHDIRSIARTEKDLNYKRLKIKDLINAHHAILSQCEDLQKIFQ